MARSEHLDRAEDHYRNAFPDPAAGVDVLRTAYDEFLLQFPTPPDAQITEVDAGGVGALAVRAPGADDSAVLVWIHGGGYVLGSPKAFEEMAYRFSQASGLTVLLPDYRLAPEHKFPAALEDAIVAIDWAIEHYGAEQTFIGGDSAGGGLALAAVIARRDQGSPAPAAIALVSPFADLALTGQHFDEHAVHDVAATRDGLTGMAQAYLQGHDAADPLVSPVYADLSSLPPVLAMCGTREALSDDSRRIVEGIGAAGGEAVLSPYDDMCHVWTFFASFLPEGAQAVEEAGAFLRKHRGQ